MNKLELSKKKSSEVRNNTTLFSLFKGFLMEDWGAIPSGCFGCEFNRYFNKWALQINKGEVLPIIQNQKNNSMNSYTLKNENFKTYHKGEVLSKNSSDTDWSDYINSTENEIEKRKFLFLVLPSDVSTDLEKAKEIEVIAEIEEKKSDDLVPIVVAKQRKKKR